MRLCGASVCGPPRDRAGARRSLARALELDVHFIETADSYGPQANERPIAEALYPYPAGLVIATKGGLVRPAPERRERDGRPAHLRCALQGSLTRLRLERWTFTRSAHPTRGCPTPNR